MPRALSSAISAGLSATRTAPGHLVELTIGTSVLRYSSRGDLTWDGQTWTGGARVQSSSAADWTLALDNHDNAASAMLLANDANTTRARIWAYSGHADPPDAVLVFDGGLDRISAVTLERVELALTAAAPGRTWLPDAILAPPLLNHLPVPGTAITWGDQTYLLEPG